MFGGSVLTSVKFVELPKIVEFRIDYSKFHTRFAAVKVDSPNFYKPDTLP